MLRISTPWDSQPQEAVGVDWGNPLARDLSLCLNPAANGTIDVATGETWTTWGTAPVNGTGAAGRNIDATAAFGGWKINPAKNVATAAQTHLLLIDYTSISANFAGMFGSFKGDGSASSICYQEGGGTSTFLVRTGAIGGGATSTASAFNNKVFVLAGDATSSAVYVDGAFLSPSLASGVVTQTTSRVVIFGERLAAAANATKGKFYIYAGWTRRLTDLEIASVSKNPWQLFAPRTIWVPVSAGGGGTSISGALGAAVASGFTGAINANRSIAGALGTATASGFTGTVSNSTNTAITGAPGVATASGFKGTVGANRCIAGALGTAVASGFTGAVTNDNSTTIAGALGTATASGFTGAITWNRYISGLLGEAQASGFAGGVQNGAAPVIASGGGIYPTPRRKTKQEIDEDRKRLGILPDEPEVQTGIVEVAPVKRPRITLEQLIGKPAADTHRADMERASAAHKLRKRRQDDDLLMMM